MASDLVLAMAEVPGLARDIRDIHVATPDGRCCVCSAGPQAGHVRHPCRLHDVAVAALAQIARQREPE
jgi:hypothetical protein